MMLWANSHGWSPSPRKVFWTAAGAVAVLVNITPVGSGDIASYAAYGRLAALGYNPYTAGPNRLPRWNAQPVHRDRRRQMAETLRRYTGRWRPGRTCSPPGSAAPSRGSPSGC